MNFGREMALLRQQLTAAGSPERAAAAKAALPAGVELQCLGAGPDAVREAATALATAHPETTRAQLTAFVKKLWQTNMLELRGAGIVLLERRAELLEPPDLAFLVELLRTAKLESQFDPLVQSVVGPFVLRHKKLHKDLRRWAEEANPWLRRGALLALAPLAAAGDLALFTTIAVPLLGDPDPLVQTALSEVLRSAGKAQPAAIGAFLAQHGAAMAPSTLREARKGLPKS